MPLCAKKAVCVILLCTGGVNSFAAALSQVERSHPRAVSHTGMADASAGVPVGPDRFLVANDEDNVLRLYRRDQPGAPIQTFDLSRFPGFSKSESDIEGAARTADRIYWITSHGANKEGKPRPDRHRLFATSLAPGAHGLEMDLVGRPYANLIQDLDSDPRYRAFQLASAATRAPKSMGALNIEGLAATPDGALLIGFRNPLFEGKALIARLLNPAEVVSTAAKPRFSDPVHLDLGGLGIRDLLWNEDSCLVLAGPRASGGPFRVYRWKEHGSAVLLETVTAAGFSPEAMLAFPAEPGAKPQLVLLSDDGTRVVDGVEAKKLKNKSRQSFRSLILPIP